VIPESVAPIIPKATTYQGEFLSPVKNELEVDLREVKYDIVIKIPKYPKMMNNAIEPFTSLIIYDRN
jgi:hypothetical protein